MSFSESVRKVHIKHLSTAMSNDVAGKHISEFHLLDHLIQKICSRQAYLFHATKINMGELITAVT